MRSSRLHAMRPLGGGMMRPQCSPFTLAQTDVFMKVRRGYFHDGREFGDAVVNMQGRFGNRPAQTLYALLTANPQPEAMGAE